LNNENCHGDKVELMLLHFVSEITNIRKYCICRVHLTDFSQNVLKNVMKESNYLSCFTRASTVMYGKHIGLVDIQNFSKRKLK